MSRLRRVLGAEAIASEPGGYRLAVAREDVDLTAFQDLVAAARRHQDAALATVQATEALSLWTGDPWTPGLDFDWVVRDLLEDRAHAERIIREAAGSPTAEPAPPAAPAAIPAALTPLVGRHRELATIGAQLSSERLVTLIGPGGAGKTTLALETARAWGDATVIVELAPAAPGRGVGRGRGRREPQHPHRRHDVAGARRRRGSAPWMRSPVERS